MNLSIQTHSIRKNSTKKIIFNGLDNGSSEYIYNYAGDRSANGLIFEMEKRNKYYILLSAEQDLKNNDCNVPMIMNPFCNENRTIIKSDEKAFGIQTITNSFDIAYQTLQDKVELYHFSNLLYILLRLLSEFFLTNELKP